jgi:hypothetical protein
VVRGNWCHEGGCHVEGGIAVMHNVNVLIGNCCHEAFMW